MKKVVLLIADGWGIAPPGPGNYIEQAATPVMDELWKQYPHTQNAASGNAVGLPEGAQGNSEVGHLHIGAGRIVWQMFELINRAITNGSLAKNEQLVSLLDKLKDSQKTLHLIGLCSDEGVHAHVNHLLAVLKLAQAKGVETVVHFIADGRDVPERSAAKYVKEIEQAGGQIVSMIGRFFAMDRDKNWERTKVAYDLLVNGVGQNESSAQEALDHYYQTSGKSDYYLPAIVLKPVTIAAGDAVFCFNFRTDRPRQLIHALLDQDFTEFERGRAVDFDYLAMTAYDKQLLGTGLFEEEKITNNLGQVLAEHNLKQLRVAETEKYAHVTYFFNSQIEEPNPGEDRELVPSSKVSSYDQKPEMSAPEITDVVEKNLSTKQYDFVLINYANGDLVGHSADKTAIIKAMEVVDECIGRVKDACAKNGYTLIITADHGSAEDKLYEDGDPKPSHSLNPVPFIVVGNQSIQLKSGGQQDVAPTVLQLMGIPKPPEMTGKSLIT